MDAEPDRERLARAAAVSPPDVAELDALGLLDPGGLGQVLDLASGTIRDDPGAGAALARLVIAGLDAVRASEPREPAGEEIDGLLASAHYLLAQAAATSGDLQEALGLLERARAGFEAAGDPWSALRTNLGRTHILNEMGHHTDALAASRTVVEAIEAGRVTGPPGSGPGGPVATQALAELLAAAEQNSGLCHELMGSFTEALAAYDRAEAGYRRAGADRARAEVHLDRAMVLITLGRFGDALAQLDGAVDTFRRGGFRALTAQALTQRAEALLQRGELRRCLAELDEARETLAAIDAPIGDHQRALVAGRAYLELNLLPEALATFGAAVTFLEGSDLVVERARAQWGRGLALAGLGRRAEAAEAIDRAVDQFRSSGHHGWLAAALVDRARLHGVDGGAEEARAALEEALDLATRHNLPVTEVRAHLLLGEAAAPPAGDRHLEEAHDRAGELRIRTLLALTGHALGRRRLHQGDPAAAAKLLGAAIDATEATRGALTDDALLQRYLDDKRSPYEDLIDLLIGKGTGPEAAGRALAVAERGKSRALGELVSGVIDVPAGSGDLDAELRAVQWELFSEGISPDRRAVLLERLSTLEQTASLAQLERSERALRLAPGAADRSGGTAGSPDPEPGPPAGPWPTVLSYACANGAVHAFVVAGEGGDVVSVPGLAPVAEVAGLVDRLGQQFSRVASAGERLERHLPQLLQATSAVLASLHRLLIEPVLAHLPADGAPAPLVIVPDGPLHAVPFQALDGGSGPLLDRHVISYAPSIEILHAARPPGPGRMLVVGVGDELAPQVEDEARAIASGVGDATLLVGPDATWAAVREALDGVAHLHLAGHAVFRPDSPMYSALRLADRWVTAADLLQLDLRGHTVALSACGTARTDGIVSTEVVGFVRALLGAGAASVVASQWAADDATTAAIMGRWYRDRVVSGSAEALRTAQQAAARERAHPYFWAPWILTGGRF